MSPGVQSSKLFTFTDRFTDVSWAFLTVSEFISKRVLNAQKRSWNDQKRSCNVNSNGHARGQERWKIKNSERPKTFMLNDPKRLWNHVHDTFTFTFQIRTNIKFGKVQIFLKITDGSLIPTNAWYRYFELISWKHQDGSCKVLRLGLYPSRSGPPAPSNVFICK